MNKLLLINTFVTGYLIMSLEMIVGRILTPYFGSSLIVWASVISITLFAMSAGYLRGGIQADSTSNKKHLGAKILMAGVYILIISYFINHIETFSTFFPNIYVSCLLSVTILLFIPCYFLSTYSPHVLKFSLKSTDSTGVTSGKLYAIATLGSIVGTLLTSFVLINYFNLDFLFIMTGFVTIVCGLSVLLDFRFYIIPLTFSILILVVYLFNIQSSDFTPVAVETVLEMEDGNIEKAVSDFSTIYISKSNSRIMMHFNIENKTAMESARDILSPESISMYFARLMTYSIVFPDKLDRILVLGLGGGTVSTYLKKYLKNTSFEVIEIDEKVIGLSKKYFNVVEDENYKIFNKDARLYLNQSKEKYDLILQDTFRGSVTPFHLTTKEFFMKVKSKLTENGCLAINIPRRRPNDKIFVSQLSTLKAVFPELLVLQSGGNHICISCNSKNFLNNKLDIATKLQDKYGFYHPLHEYTFYIEKALDIHGDIYTDNFSPLNLVSI